MNKQRRAIISQLLGALEPLEGDIANLDADENEAFGNLSEGLQQSDQGQRTEASAEALTRAHEAYDELLGALNEALDQ